MLETASMGFSKMKMMLLALTKVCNNLKVQPLPTELQLWAPEINSQLSHQVNVKRSY